MKNKLLRKYKITCRVRPLDAPENIVSLRYVGMHNRFTDDSRRVCRSDAPENLVSSRYVGMHNGDADDTKTAETLVLSGFAGGGGLLSKPRAAFHPIAHPATLRHPATRMRALHSNCHLAGWTQSTLTHWEPAKDERPPLRHPAAVSWRTKKSRCLAGSQTKNRHKLRLTCVFVMQKKVVI